MTNIIRLKMPGCPTQHNETSTPQSGVSVPYVLHTKEHGEAIFKPAQSQDCFMRKGD